jgi:hypothetical protein
MTPEPMSASAVPVDKIARARRAALVHRDRRRDYQTARERTLALPLLSSIVDDTDREGLAVLVSEGAELCGVSPQALHQANARGTLDMYQADGHRWILLDDLLASAPGRRQAARLAAEELARAMAEDRHANGYTTCRANGLDCHLCPLPDEGAP